MMLLEGLGIDGSRGDGDPVFHQALPGARAAVPLLVLRLPPVTRWIARQQKAGRQRLVYLAVLALAALFVLRFAFLWKGTMAITRTSSTTVRVTTTVPFALSPAAVRGAPRRSGGPGLASEHPRTLAGGMDGR